MRVAAWIAVLVFHANTAVAAPDVEGQAKALEQRLLAPCCWTQTLDVHESPLVTEMRLEIRSRLAAGEAPLAIEDSFAQRHGERVRAMPRGKNPLVTFAQWMLLALGGSAVALFAVARRWRKRASTSETTGDVSTERQLDAALDEELNQALTHLK